MRIWKRSIELVDFKESWIYYNCPINFNYFWNFGVLSLFMLSIQIASGLVLACMYTASVEFAFESIITMTNDLFYGWWVRHLHSNGASFFFIVVYIHICRNLYYGSYMYPRQTLWYSGVVILLLMIATAFLGYVLPWGQMSFWGAMVITSLFGAIPLVGPDLMLLLWGGFTLGDVTLHRFYVLHFLCPFIIVFMVVFHLLLLHSYGSNNPLGISSHLDSKPILKYYGIKDALTIVVLIAFIVLVITYSPGLFGHTDNYIEANALVTPSHIVPEWYFLFMYAVLRSVTNKLLGIFLIACVLGAFLLMPVIMNNGVFRTGLFRPLYRIFIIFFLMDLYLLFWIGGLPVMEPYLTVGQVLTALFFILLLILRAVNHLEKVILLNSWNSLGNQFLSAMKDFHLFFNFLGKKLKKLFFMIIRILDNVKNIIIPWATHQWWRSTRGFWRWWDRRKGKEA